MQKNKINDTDNQQEKTSSSGIGETPWSGNFDERELTRPGGILLAALICCANERRLKFGKMAEELNVTYSYINHLRNGIRHVEKISDTFALACAKFLGVPRMTILMYAGKVTSSDLVEGENMLAHEVSRAIGFICGDIKWGHMVTQEQRRADAISQFGLVKLYEAATGKVLLDKTLDCQSLELEIAKLKEIQAKRESIVCESSLKKRRNRLAKDQK